MLIDQTILNGTSLVDFDQFIGYFSRYPLIIPNNYQRDYKWAIPKHRKEETALEVFLNDFYRGLHSNKVFVLGNIVCVAHDPSKKILHLADGQQRITTLFVLLLEVLKRDPDYLSKRSNSFLLMDSGKLRLQQSNEEWDDLFRDTLLSKADEPLLNIALAQSIINNFIDSCEDFNIIVWRDYILTNIKFNLQWVPIECEEEYFIDVNQKGEILNSVDNLKLDIIKSLSQEEGEALWCEFTTEINKFRGKTLSSKVPNIEEAILTHALYINNTIDSLDRSSLKKAIYSLNFNGKFLLCTAVNFIKYLNKGEDICLQILNYLKNMNIIVMYYKLLSLGFSQENALKRCCKHSFSTMISSQADIVSLSKNILYDRELKISVDDNRFKYGPNKSNLRFLLFCIEAYLQGGDWINNLLHLISTSKDTTLEHIQSQQFGGSDSLGNLTLLSKSDNSKLNNLQEKMQIYRNSHFLITRCFSSDYSPNSDYLRKTRALYLPSLSSEALDRYAEQEVQERFDNIVALANEIFKET